jgi:hypothetical protein
MIWNIIDRRERPYRWREVNAIVEAVEHDNSCQDADQAPDSDPTAVADYDALEAVSVEEAIDWASRQRCPVTLYLYDSGRGLAAEEHFHAVSDRFSDSGG